MIPAQLEAAGKAARASGHADADERLARLVLDVVEATAVSAPVLGERVHLIGIGGAGMSGIARILLARGVAVSGSDAKDSRAVLALRALGARVDVGHDAAHLPPDATVVVSTAIRETNPELAAARERGLPVVHRAQALAALTVGRRVAAVAGTHGKTSTTSMLTVALQHCGLDPSFAIGGDLTTTGAGAHHGDGDVFVVEADESDGSFTAFTPDVAVITNVEPDHLDHHGTEQAYRAVFADFVDRIRPGGTLIACTDDPGVAPLVARARDRGLTVRRYGHGRAGRRRAARVHPARRRRPRAGPARRRRAGRCGSRCPASTWP